ncbi:putative HAF family extracellular repeat protein [Haloferula luteola]|uniref:Putative HAF family extracellular repeat protein n=1 Tax=Haloferula luteola TaxID=595692 RepID=A0A840VEY0_9BACT|nr:immunoglobulin domain-containing protein [Haloferula luteola]MBB5353188.1 putative HAF family extracellular repeat protein [Haloferula luteola]
MNPTHFQVALLLAATLPTATALPPDFVKIEPLGTLDGNFSEAVAINDSGDSVGLWEKPNGQVVGFLHQAGELIDLDATTGSQTNPRDISHEGVVVGSAHSGSVGGSVFAFVFQNGSLRNITTSSLNSVATSIDGTTVVGTSSGKAFAYDLTTQAIRSLPVTGTTTSAESVNAHGVILGSTRDGSSRPFVAYTLDGDHFIEISPLATGFSTNPRDINDLGQVVGDGATGSSKHAFLHASGSTTDLGTLPGDNTSLAHAINNSGTAVGESILSNSEVYDQNAFLFDQGTLYDLNDLARHLLAAPGQEGFVHLETANDINESGQIVGLALYRTQSGEELLHAYRLTPGDLPQVVIHDVNILGNPHGQIPNAAVTLRVGGEIVDQAESDFNGRIPFGPENPTDPSLGIQQLNVNPDAPYDLEVRLGDLVRVYESVIPQQIIDGDVEIALPVTLRAAVVDQATRLENTGTFVLAYSTLSLHDLLALWSSTEPQSAEIQAQRDFALGRLLAATQSFADIHFATETLCFDSGKMMANTVLSFLAFRKAATSIENDLKLVAAQQALANGAQQFVIDFALKSLVVSMKVIAANLQGAFIKGLKTFAPPWAVTLIDTSLSTIISTTLSGMGNRGAWNKKAGVAGGRRTLLETIAKLASEQVGGRILSSAFVLGQSPHLSLAVTRAKNLQGSGEVVDHRALALRTAIDLAEEKDQAILASSLVLDTTKKWGQVADISQVVGRIPGAQVVLAMSKIIRGMNIATITGATINDFATVTEAQDAAADAPQQAFGFPTSAPGAPLESASGPLLGKAQPRDTAPELFPEYRAALDAVITAIGTGDFETAIQHASFLIDADAEFDARIRARVLQAIGVSSIADPPQPALNQAATNLEAAEFILATARSEAYTALGGYALPAFADPEASDASVLGFLDALGQALSQFENLAAAVDAESTGLVAPALVMAVDHGLDVDSFESRTAPGPITLRALIVNAGGTSAEDVEVQIAAADTGEEAPSIAPWQLISAPGQILGTLAPGETREVTWQATAIDNSPDAGGSVGVYAITITANGLDPEIAQGGFEIGNDSAPFEEWVEGFGDLGPEDGFEDDPNQDGIPNGLARYFGFDPNHDSPQVGWKVLSDGGRLRFEHPLSDDPGQDAIPAYQWSADLTHWFGSGESSDGQSVILNPQLRLDGAARTVEITPEVTGPRDELFVRLMLTQEEAPPAPTEPRTPTIVHPLSSAFVFEGSSASLSIEVDADPPIIYLWTKDGVDLPDVEGPVLNIESAQISDSGNYRVRIITPGGSLTSESAELTVESGGAFSNAPPPES